jgi:membrane protein YqaA with SNARE-associated domain
MAKPCGQNSSEGGKRKLVAPRPVEGLLTSLGLGLLFVLIMLESAGIPLPGETALIAAGLLAAKGRYEIWQVIVVAAAAAIIGDNLGYWAARHYGLRLVDRWARLKRHSDRALPPAERFFKAHGGKTIFIARFVAILRFTAALLAGRRGCTGGSSSSGTPRAGFAGQPAWACSPTTAGRRLQRRSTATG